MKICSKCGNILKDEDVFCSRCGAKTSIFGVTKKQVFQLLQMGYSYDEIEDYLFTYGEHTGGIHGRK